VENVVRTVLLRISGTYLRLDDEEYDLSSFEQSAPTSVPSGPGTGKVPSERGFVRDGALAGAISVVVFTAVHHLIISDIWVTLPLMLFAGVICGMCLAWTFESLFRSSTMGRWVIWNLVILASLAALAIASLIIYEPVVAMSAIMERGGPVDGLVVRALPLTAIFAVVVAGALGLAFRAGATGYGRLLVTTTLLMLLVGINLSVLGLVDFAGDSLRPVSMFFGLVILLDAVYAIAFGLLRRGRLTRAG
jgi:hypothetical protein